MRTTLLPTDELTLHSLLPRDSVVMFAEALNASTIYASLRVYLQES